VRPETNDREVSRWLVAGFTLYLLLLSMFHAGCAPRPSKVVPAPNFTSTAALTKPPLAERLAQGPRSSPISTVSDRRSTSLHGDSKPGDSKPGDSKPGDSKPGDWKPGVAARQWNFIVLHHSGAPTGDVESIEADHRQRRDSTGRPWLGIGYHFVIGNGHGMADGQIEPTFRWREQLHGAHAGNRHYNQQGIGICLVGDFNSAPPTPRQIASLKRLVDSLGKDYSIDPESVVRHSDVVATECPGSQFPWGALFGRETGTLVP